VSSPATTRSPGASDPRKPGHSTGRPSARAVGDAISALGVRGAPDRVAAQLGVRELGRELGAIVRTAAPAHRELEWDLVPHPELEGCEPEARAVLSERGNAAGRKHAEDPIAERVADESVAEPRALRGKALGRRAQEVEPRAEPRNGAARAAATRDGGQRRRSSDRTLESSRGRAVRHGPWRGAEIGENESRLRVMPLQTGPSFQR
jgi:hypothetical protein